MLHELEKAAGIEKKSLEMYFVFLNWKEKLHSIYQKYGANFPAALGLVAKYVEVSFYIFIDQDLKRTIFSLDNFC